MTTRGSTKESRSLNANAGQPFRLQHSVSAHSYDRGIAVGPGFPANLDLCAGKIDDPELRNGVTCVQRALHGAVVVQTGVGHFDQEQYVGRPGVGAAIEVRPRPEEREVRLRLAR